MLKRLFTPENTQVFLVLALAFAVRLYVGFAWPSTAWPDEVFQSLEQAHRLAFGYGMIPWEFRDGIRSWVLPGLLSVLMRAGEALFGPPAGHLTPVVVTLSLVSLTPVWVAMRWARQLQLKSPWLAGLTVAGWYELIYFSNKALTEAMATWALVPMVYGLWLLSRPEASRRVLIGTGLLLGLVVGLRFHLVPALGLTVLFVTRKDWRLLLKISAVALGVFCIFGLVDWVTWGTPFQSVWKNFWVNLVEKKSEYYGVAPWYEYFAGMAGVWHWSAIPLLGTAWVAWRRAPVLGLAALLTLLLHTALAHKEYRFLLPSITLVLVSSGLGVALLAERSRGTGVALVVVLLGASVWGAQRYDWRILPPRPPKFPPTNMWAFNADWMRSFRWLQNQPGICGIGFTGVGWGHTGGYTWLHRETRLFALETKEEFISMHEHVNAMVAPSDYEKHLQPFGFSKSFCSNSSCVFTHPGVCKDNGIPINDWLKQHKQ